MSTPNPHVKRPSLLRRWWKPAAATGAGGGAISLWYEEIILFAEEIFTLISIVLLASVIYLLNFILFKTQMPRKED